jgi:CsoR family transcriptional regulator, copper-sensing transcriptional repressor
MNDWQDSKERVLARLKRAEGQVRAVVGMIERDEDCEKVAQQLTAARKALDRSFFDMMACVTRKELADAGVKGKQINRKLDELTQLLARYG